MAVSAVITNRPEPAKTMFAEVLLRKNLPSSVPVGSKTFYAYDMSQSHPDAEQTTYMYAIACARIHISLIIKLDTIWYTSINVRENPAVCKDARLRVNIKSVAACGG